jgi:hypothetical protein
MNRIGVAFGTIALLAAPNLSAVAKAASQEEILQRLDRLEKEKAALKKELNRIQHKGVLPAQSASQVSSQPNSQAKNQNVDPYLSPANAVPKVPPLAAAPVYKAPPAAVVSDNFYFFLDGAYDNVRLPTYSLGFHNVGPGAGFPDLGPVQNLDRRSDGAGVRGAFGISGVSARIEVGGSYIAARGTTSQTANSTQFVSAPLLSGAGAVAFNCSPSLGLSCNTVGSLTTNYSAWQFNGKIADDLRYGTLTVTPSAALFGSNSRANQSFTQVFTDMLTGVGVISTGTYAASTTLNWTDLGGRVGLDVNAPLTNALTFGIGGWVGAAARTVSMTGNDTAASAPPPVFNGASAISAGANKGVFLANAEAGFAYRWTPVVTLRAFGGVNYDNKVPGITNPTFAGSVNAPTSATPANIYFANETSFYGGGGFLVRF